MVNQNPQPELYTTRHPFDTGTTVGTVNTQQIYTSQSFNEEVRIYGMKVNFVDVGGNVQDYNQLRAGGEYLWDVSIQAGPNRIPSNAFSASDIIKTGEQTIAFSNPVLILHRQPLQVSVECRGPGTMAGADRVVAIITLIAEQYIRHE
tara:strand:+ start:98 stop:541 length:444 start_codon:yes stop_codon:yes gene_type:complete